MPPYETSAEALAPRTSLMDLPDNTQVRQYRTMIVILCVTPPIFFLRFVSRYLHRMRFGWDDFTLVVGFILAYGASSMALLSLHYGLGVHAWDLSKEQVAMVTKLLYIFEMIYTPCLTLLKISVLLMYYRLFPIKPMRIGIYILAGMVLAWYISTTLVAALQCNPPAKLWDDSIPGFCLDPLDVLIGPGVPNFVTDILILALPVKPIWDLHVSISRKLLIVFTFLTGFFVVGVSIYRLATQSQFQPADLTYTIANAMSWCVVEMGSGVISCCLPTLMPVINYVLSHFAWGQRWMKQDKSYSASRSGTHRQFKQLTINSIDDHEQRLTVSSDSKNFSPNHLSTWQIHRPKGDEERSSESDISKPPRIHESEPLDVEMDNMNGIRVMQKVEIIDNNAWR